MEVTRQQSKADDQLYDYTITNEGKKLQIVLNKKGDLYWLMDGDEPTDYASFSITKENEYIYSLFARLYMQIMRYQEGKELSQGTIAHYLLTSEDKINWVSDKDDYDEADVVSISKEEDEFLLEFIHQNTDFPLYYKPGMFDICFSKDNSRFAPFNMAFMNMYQKLQNYDPEYHQIHLDELAFQKVKAMSR